MSLPRIWTQQELEVIALAVIRTYLNKAEEGIRSAGDPEMLQVTADGPAAARMAERYGMK